MELIVEILYIWIKARYMCDFREYRTLNKHRGHLLSMNVQFGKCHPQPHVLSFIESQPQAQTPGIKETFKFIHSVPDGLTHFDTVVCGLEGNWDVPSTF
jgi:hypothetical protein